MTNKFNGKTGPEFLQSIAQSLRELPNIKYLAKVVEDIDKKAKLATPSTTNTYGEPGLVSAPPPLNTTGNKVSFFGSDTQWHSGIEATLNKRLLHVERDSTKLDNLYYLLATNTSGSPDGSIDRSFDTAYTDLGVTINHYIYDGYEFNDQGILAKLNDPDFGSYTSGGLSRLNVGYDRVYEPPASSDHTISYGEINVHKFLNLNSNSTTDYGKPAASIVMGEIQGMSAASTYKPYVMKVIGNTLSLYHWLDDRAQSGPVTFFKADSDPYADDAISWYIKSQSNVVKSLSTLHMTNAKIMPLWYQPSSGRHIATTVENGDSRVAIGKNGINFLTKYHPINDSGQTVSNQIMLRGLSLYATGSQYNTDAVDMKSYSYEMQTWGNFRIGLFDTPRVNVNAHPEASAYNTDLINQILLTSNSTIVSSTISTRSNMLHIAPINNPIVNGTRYDNATHWGSSNFSSLRERIATGGHKTMSELRFYGPYTPEYYHETEDDASYDDMPDANYYYYTQVRDLQAYIALDVNNAEIQDSNGNLMVIPDSNWLSRDRSYYQSLRLYSVLPGRTNMARELLNIRTKIVTSQRAITSVGDPEMNVYTNVGMNNKLLTGVNQLSVYSITGPTMNGVHDLRADSAILYNVNIKKLASTATTIEVSSVIETSERLRATKDAPTIGIDTGTDTAYYFRPTMVVPSTYISDPNVVQKKNNAPNGTILFIY